jgi:hypothetical protein
MHHHSSGSCRLPLQFQLLRMTSVRRYSEAHEGVLDARLGLSENVTDEYEHMNPACA